MIGKSIDWEEELKRFYAAINMPDKLNSKTTEQILEMWAGQSTITNYYSNFLVL